MEINAKEVIGNAPNANAAFLSEKEAVRTPDEIKANATKPNSDVARTQAPVKRPPPVLVHAVSQGLAQSGIAVGDTAAVPAAGAAASTSSSNDLEKAQSEKVSQAMQEFMHALVQAANSRQETTDVSGNKPVGSQVPRVEQAATGAVSRQAGEAYAGLTSRLESLARQLEGASPQANANAAIDDLSRSFRDLASVAGSATEGTGGTPPPKLQEVVRAVARNLQSTGDPTLATTGNVINTSA